ncbi:MAG: hypothetical protein CMP48_07945 [Rickettsiales bacterium]|nr:hypothetical protein [Rickettsiales bacterium]
MRAVIYISLVLFAFSNVVKGQKSVKTIIEAVEANKMIYKDHLLLLNSNDQKERTFRVSPDLKREILSGHSEFLSVLVPDNAEDNLRVFLRKMTSNGKSIKIRTSSGDSYSDDLIMSRTHYVGFVEGFEGKSLVSISLINGNLSGFIAISGKETLLLSKGSNKDEYKLLENNSKPILGSGCDMPDGIPQSEELKKIYKSINRANLNAPLVEGNQLQNSISVGNHVSVYVETNYFFYDELGSVNNVAEFIIALYNQVTAIYTLEDIFLYPNELFIWTTSDGYASGSSSDALSDFIDERPSITNSDLGQLLVGKTTVGSTGAGGIANGWGGICGNTCTTYNGQCSNHSAVLMELDYENFPTYSRQVKVITHEMGHNLGSYHTHDCAWGSSGDDAIDSCPGTSCSPDPGNPPSNGGTIMSYCDSYPSGSPVGVDFTLGFGNEPGDVIRAVLSTANCSCNLVIDDHVISANSEIEACDVDLSNILIENNANVDILYSGNVEITGEFEVEVGCTLSISPDS